MGMGWGWFKGMAGDNKAHAHRAIQIVLSHSPQRVWTSAGWTKGHGILIGSNVFHQLAPSCQPISLIYFEPDSDAGQLMLAEREDSISTLSVDLVRIALELLDAGKAESIDSAHFASAIFCANQARAHRRNDDLIRKVIVELPAPLPEPITVSHLAKRAGLSVSRFQHRFRAHVGMAVRPYLRWRRMLLASSLVLQGSSITDAALEAGFSDAAHFSNTLRRHFGISPRTLGSLIPS